MTQAQKDFIEQNHKTMWITKMQKELKLSFYTIDKYCKEKGIEPKRKRAQIKKPHVVLNGHFFKAPRDWQFLIIGNAFNA